MNVSILSEIGEHHDDVKKCQNWGIFENGAHPKNVISPD